VFTVQRRFLGWLGGAKKGKQAEEESFHSNDIEIQFSKKAGGVSGGAWLSGGRRFPLLLRRRAWR